MDNLMINKYIWFICFPSCISVVARLDILDLCGEEPFPSTEINGYLMFHDFVTFNLNECHQHISLLSCGRLPREGNFP